MNSSYQIIKVVAVIADVFKLSALSAFVSILTACTASNSLEKTTTSGAQAPHAQATDKPSAHKHLMGPILTLNTVVTAEGVECAAVRGADGTLYTIPSMPDTFEEGDTLNIIVADPIVPVASFCQQGQTIDWMRIERVSASGEILKYWEK